MILCTFNFSCVHLSSFYRLDFSVEVSMFNYLYYFLYLLCPLSSQSALVLQSMLYFHNLFHTLSHSERRPNKVLPVIDGRLNIHLISRFLFWHWIRHWHSWKYYLKQDAIMYVLSLLAFTRYYKMWGNDSIQIGLCSYGKAG